MDLGKARVGEAMTTPPVQDAAPAGLGRRALAATLPWLAVLAITAALAEGGARLAGVAPLTDGSLLWRHHPRWGWHHEPGAEDVFVKVAFSQRIHINSRGLRERELPYEKPAGVTRVLVLGDSSVASFEVPPEAVFTRLAEDALRERGYAVEFVNAGVRGWGTDQALLFLKEEGLRYEPDLVLYKWTANDAQDNGTVHRPFRRFGKPWFSLGDDGRLALRGVPVPSYPYAANTRVGDDGEAAELPVDWRSRATLWVRDVAICHSAFGTALLRIALSVPSSGRSLTEASAYDDTRDVSARLDTGSALFRTTVELVREMRRTAEGAGARFAMIGPSRAPVDWGRAVREAAGEPDLGEHERYLARLEDPAAVLVPFDPHWNELGHRLYAEALVESLEASGLLASARR
jgi:hypothetical protein